MIGFDPAALARLLRRWTARRADPDPIVAAQWVIACEELALVIRCSPFTDRRP